MFTSQHAYDEAMSLPHLRLQIPESDLRQGAVAQMTIAATSGSYQRPWGQNGAFAVVYKFTTHSGQTKALRCFRVAMPADIRERYEALRVFLATHLPENTAGFRYYHEGILIEEHVQGGPQRVAHAVLVMDWVRGETLLNTVHTLCREQDQSGLARLAEQWLTLLDRMSRVHLAHGDLAGRNVLVRDDGSLVLIDYDGCYIPQFQGKSPLVNGQPDYQHPQTNRRAFDEEMDSFSAYVIYIALRALQLHPSLWTTYAPQDRQGTLTEDRLLFAQQDFLDPDHSPLFRDFACTADPVLYALTQLLKCACHQPIEQMLLPPLGTALVQHLQTSAPIQGDESARGKQQAYIIGSLRYDLLRHSLHLQRSRDALRLTEQIEANEGLLPEALRGQVHEIRQQFLASLHSDGMQASRHPQTGEVEVRWQWPDENLVRWAAVAWRTDRWPSNPCEQGTYLYHPVARGNESSGSFRFPAPLQQRIWLQLYFALPETSPGRTMPGITWHYSESVRTSACLIE